MTDFSDSPSHPVKKNKSGSVWSSMQTVILVALLMATLFTLWTPTSLFSNQMIDNMLQAWQEQPVAYTYPTATPQPAVRIGIVAGHKGNDSGAVCADGLREVDVNTSIASLVQGKLTALGYQVDLLDEFDPRLAEYQAMLLVSIHNDSCDPIHAELSGFKVAAAKFSAYPDKAIRLEKCLIDRYHMDTGLPYHADTITTDMTDYHTFREIHTETTAAIIETGFLYSDREFLTKSPDLAAQGIVDGITCYVRNENLSPFVTGGGE